MKYLISSIDDYSEDEICKFLPIIYDSKRKRIEKFVNKTRLKQSVVGEILLRNLLKTYGINYSKSFFETNMAQKPYIKNCNVFFNISHSSNYVICVTSENNVGVDIEKIRKINTNDIKFFATKNEQNYILSDDKSIYERAFIIYTLKESYYKLLNCTLDEAKKTEFSIAGDTIICSNNNVKCKLIKDLPNYIIAICEIKNYTNV